MRVEDINLTRRLPAESSMEREMNGIARQSKRKESQQRARVLLYNLDNLRRRECLFLFIQRLQIVTDITMWRAR